MGALIVILIGGVGGINAQPAAGAGAGFGGSTAAPANPWHPIKERSFTAAGPRWIIPTKYSTVAVDLATLDGQLAQAPAEQKVAARNSAASIAIPLFQRQVAPQQADRPPSRNLHFRTDRA